jgi:DNA-binding NarL/FixJ family response regulator
LFLKRTQSLQPTVPLVATAGAWEIEWAQKALELGAFGIIPSPHNPDDTLNLVRLGLWQNTLLRMIASQEKAREKYHQHLAAYPANKHNGESFKNNLLVMEKAFASFEETINRIDETLAFFSAVANDARKQAQQSTLEQLRRLTSSR